MALRIALDLDGVLADLESALIRHATTLFGEVITRELQQPEEIDSGSEPDGTLPVVRLGLTGRQQRDLWRHVATITDFWQSLNEIEPGMVSRLSEIARARRWEIIFLTKRPQSAGATVQVQSQRWLDERGFTLPAVYVAPGPRGRIASALGLDVVVDTSPANCVNVVTDSNARAILVWPGDRSALPAEARRPEITLVKSLGECLDMLTAVDEPHRQRDGLFAWIRRLFGSREAKA